MITWNRWARICTRANQGKDDLSIMGLKANGEMFVGVIKAVRYLPNRDQWQAVLDLRTEEGWKLIQVGRREFNSYVLIENGEDERTEKGWKK